jgi:hypothetical protein
MPIILIIFLAVPSQANPGPPTLTINPTKTLYNLGETAILSGILTQDGNPIPNALVTVELLDPADTVILLRIANTSQPMQNNWPMEIQQFYPCDSSGNQVFSYHRGIQGVNAGFKFVLRNPQATDRHVMVMLCIVYSTNTPSEIGVTTEYSGIVEAYSNVTVIVWPIPLTFPPLGLTNAYCNVLTDWPANNGFALCPEKPASFTITQSMSQAETQQVGTEAPTQQTANGTYGISLTINSQGGVIGVYHAYATSFISPNFASASTQFETYIRGDITSTVPGVKDGKCDIKDVSAVAKYFGRTVPPAPAYCDVFGPDGRIDIKDVSAVAKDFGKWGTLP